MGLDSGFGDVLVSGGIEQAWEAWQDVVASRRAEVNGRYDVAREEGRPQEHMRVLELARLEHLATQPPPLWRMMSGLDGDEYALRPGERAARIRKLLKGIERVARVEVRAEETACKGDWRSRTPALDVGTAPDLGTEEAEADASSIEERDGRSFAWDPLRSICYYFGIAKTKLGAYAWEVWGLSAPQLVDRVKCETVRGKVRAELKAFLLKHCPENKGDDVDAIWDALRLERKGLSHRTSMAARFGFSSYARYFRACVLCYGIEPMELERVVLEEVLREHGAAVKQSDVSGVASRESGVTEIRTVEMVESPGTEGNEVVLKSAG